MFIHPDYGLWHAYRFAIALPDLIDELDQDDSQEGTDLCQQCVDQPCLDACPEAAFSNDGYDLKRCYESLAGEDAGKCMENGCRARRACPYGQDYWYQPDHARFHMSQFLLSLGNRY